jgi:hypothetical protein
MEASYMNALDFMDSPPSQETAADDDAARRSDRGKSRSRTSRVRRQKIREYRSESLTRTSPLSATIGCVTADLLELEQGIGRAVLDRLRDGAATVEEIEEYKATIDMMMRAAKLAAQNCRLEGQLAKELQENSSGGPHESASEEIASCAPTRPRDCDATDGVPEASREPTPEVADA